MRLLLCCVAVLLFATAASARDITLEQAAAFKPGVATYGEVVTALGEPSSETALSDGSRTLVYMSVRSHVKLATFVPVVGMFAGGARATTSMITFMFGPDGRLTQSSATTSHMDCSINPFAFGCDSAAGPMPPPAPPPAPAEAHPAPPVGDTSAASDAPPAPAQRHCGAIYSPTDPNAVTC
jgi:hypothetical protein